MCSYAHTYVHMTIRIVYKERYTYFYAGLQGQVF